MLTAVKGVTLIELMLVILVIGILSVVAGPTFRATQANVSQEAYRVLNDVRYAQALSMTTGFRYRWVRSSSSTYQILSESGVPVVLPTGGTTLTLSNGVSLTTNLPNNVLVFDSSGAPYINTSIPGTALSSTGTITLSGASQTKTIQITPQTGYGAIS